MRALIIAASLILFAQTSLAAGATRSWLEVRVKGRYSVETTRVSKEGTEWICRTELTPYHLSPTQPVSQKTLQALAQYRRNQKRTPSSKKLTCRDVVTVKDSSKGKAEFSVGCADQEPFEELLRNLNRNCGRN